MQAKTMRKRMLRVGWVAALCAALAMVVVATLAPTGARAQAFTFTSIVVQGNERIDDATILGFANLPRGQSLSFGQVNAATQRVVNSGLFEEVLFEPQGNTLVIRVREFPTINIINFEGNRRINDEELAALIESRERRMFSPAMAERDATAIAGLYMERGRIAAEVTPRIIQRSGNRVDLAFEIREGRVVEIERLSFVGNRAFSDARLRRVLDTKEAGLLRIFVQRDTFLERRIDLDRQLLRDFYLSRGFIDFQVLNVTSELAREGDAFFITFTVREGQSFNVGNVSAVSEIDGITTEELVRELRLRPGVTFSPTVIETNTARLERLATQRGLRFARVEPRLTRNERTRTVDVQFALVPGERIFVERIDIQGNATTLDRVIRRQFRISEGDPLNPREIREAAERIRALGFFSDVQVEGRPGSTPDQAVVDVNVEETTTGSLGFGVSFARNEGIGFAINFAEQNFLGRGQAVTLNFNTVRGSREFTVGFDEPGFLDRDLGLGVDLSYRTTSGFLFANFDTRIISGAVSLEFPVSRQGRLEVRYGAQSERISNVKDDSSILIRNDEGTAVTSRVGYSYTFDTRGARDISPVGVLLRFNQDFAGVGGDRRFIRTTALASAERRIVNDEVTLRAELEGGALNMLSGNSRITERFDLGGRMRGFRPLGVGPRDLAVDENDGLRGNYFVVARFEADFPLGLPEEYGLGGGVFMDVGTLWGLNDRNGGPDGNDRVDDSLNWRAAAGFSLFWETPIGPLRFDFSRPLRRLPYDRVQSFDLTISSRF